LIIAIDGKFKHFKDDHDLSNDNSRKVVESFPNLVYYCYPNLIEIDGLRIDTLAYNSESNAFVIIEDKKDRSTFTLDTHLVAKTCAYIYTIGEETAAATDDSSFLAGQSSNNQSGLKTIMEVYSHFSQATHPFQ
jgi:hypothetical protein